MTSLPDPWEPGRAVEASIPATRRRETGAWYTPPALAAQVVGRALEACPIPLPVVCDPACGGGAFLLAASEHLAARGHDRAAIVARMVALDIEPAAVAATTSALERWCGGAASPTAAVGDALVDAWPGCPDVVVGNPPFLSQLSASTARSPSRARHLRDRWGPAAAGYVDEAALFLLAAARTVKPAGVVALLLPEPFLATRSASSVRGEVAPFVHAVALHGDGWFEASVRVCSVVVTPGRVADPPVVEGDHWSAYLAAARGVPAVDLGPGARVGDVATVSAGFRDEYYGLVPLVAEATAGGHRLPVVTGGLIDPAVCRWGVAPARLGRKVWQAPSVDPDQLPAWAAALLRPKLVVATQTRVVEAAVDEVGGWVPATPVVSVVPGPAGPALAHLLAVLLSPPVSAWAMAATAGSALSGDALKVSAALVRDLPLPPPGESWDRAAELVDLAVRAGSSEQRSARLVEAGEAMCSAYGVDPEPVVSWWRARLPRR
jgi:hypothetical protein